MEDPIEMTPTNETTERPAAKIAPRAGLRVRVDVHVGEAEEMEEDSQSSPYWR